MSLTELGTQAGIWILDQPFLLGGGVELGTRSTVVRLADGSLLIHAPAQMSDSDASAIRALGPVRALIAPNAFHHLFLEKAVQAFPGAVLHAAPSVIAKYPKLAATPLGHKPAPAWEGQLEQIYVAGAPRLDEYVFFHLASRTLLLTDLCFNVHRSTRAMTRVVLRLMGVWDRFGPSRLGRSMYKNRAEVRASVDRILGWDFERILVTHGENIEKGGREQFRSAFAFLKG